jgi:uncharacterized membrane protein
VDEAAPSVVTGEKTAAAAAAAPVISKPLYGLVTVFAGIGTAETAYLTFLKLTATAPALCTAQGSCESVLASPWSELAGVPMPALGLLTYGGILALSISGATNKDSTEDNTRLALQFLATIAATTSLYLMVTLATKCVVLIKTRLREITTTSTTPSEPKERVLRVCAATNSRGMTIVSLCVCHAGWRANRARTVTRRRHSPRSSCCPRCRAGRPRTLAAVRMHPHHITSSGTKTVCFKTPRHTPFRREHES